MDPLTVITGALGGVTTHVFGWLKSRSDNKHEEKMAEIRIREKAAEAKAEIEVAVQHAKGEEQRASWGAFRDSFKADSKVMSSDDRPKWADAILALVDALRLSTRYLLIWACFVAVVVSQHTGTHEPSIIDTIAGLGVGWLFGERGVAGALSVGKRVMTPSMQAWGVDPDKLAQLEAEQKQG